MTSTIQDIPVEILAMVFEYQPNWVLPILGLVNRQFCIASKLCLSNYKTHTEHKKHKKPTYERIARVGWLSVLKWLRKQDPSCPWNEGICMVAAKGGHLEILKWLREQDTPCPWNSWTCSAAAVGGHLEVLKWLREQDPPCPWNADTCWEAARGGHLEVLKWLREQDPPCPWNMYECAIAFDHTIKLKKSESLKV